MTDGWQQVVVEKDPATMVPPDVAHVGPAPRPLTPALKKWMSGASPQWDIIVGLVAAVSVAGLAYGISTMRMSAGSIATNLVWTAGLCALAVWARKRNAHRREAVRAVLRDGALRFVRLVENRQVDTQRRNLYRYDAIFDVDGRRVPYTTYNNGMSMINRGQLVEVIYNPAYPDAIVPTFLLV